MSRVNTPGPTRAAIYTRISLDRYDQGEGVDRQYKDCEKLAEQRGLEVAPEHYFEDNDKSAMHGSRPAYEQLMLAVKNGEIDVIIVKWTDRLYRRLSELSELCDVLGNVPVYSVKSGDVDLSTADGRLRANIMGAVAQHESEIKSERVSDAARQRVGKGRFNGGERRFGYRHSQARLIALHGTGGADSVEVPTGPLVLVPKEAEAIKWAYDYIARGGSLRATAIEWNARGLVGTRGVKFVPQAVRFILLRPMNAGLSSYKGQLLEAQNEAPAIVGVEVWKTVQDRLKDPSRRTSVGRPANTLLVPVMRCAVCLAQGNRGSMRGQSGRRLANGEFARTYGCTEFGHVQRQRAKLDPVIEALVLAYVTDDRVATQLRKPPVTNGKIAKHVMRAAALRDQIAKFAARASEMGVDDYLAAVNPMRAELAELDKSEIAKSTKTPATIALLTSENVPKAWAAMSIDQRRTVITENIERIEVGKSWPGRSGYRVMHNVRIFRARDGIEMIPAPGSFELDEPHTLENYIEAMVAGMPPMTDETAKRTSAAIFKS